MIATVVLGIFPKTQQTGDVFLYVLGARRILRLEVNPVESAVIASALLGGKNTLIKATLEELRVAEIDSLLKSATEQIQAGEYEANTLADDAVSPRSFHALSDTAKKNLHGSYLQTLARLGAHLHCVVLSGSEYLKASLVVQHNTRNERFSIVCPVADAIALALYADVPVGIVPGLVHKALPAKMILQGMPAEMQEVIASIMPSAEEEIRLQKKMDMYNRQPLVTVAGNDGEAVEPLRPDGKVSVSIRKRGRSDGKQRVLETGTQQPAQGDTRQSAMPESETGTQKTEKSAGQSAFDQAPLTTAATHITGNASEIDDEHLRKLLQNLTPETKVRM